MPVGLCLGIHAAVSKRLVGNWLGQYMFAGQTNGDEHAREVAEWLANDEYFLSHARRIGIGELRDKGLNVVDLRFTPPIHEAVRQLYLALMFTFANTGTFKLFENSEGTTMAYGATVQAVTPTPPTP